jgi:hypothetical protein
MESNMKKKAKKEREAATLARVKKEMAKPRMSKSVFEESVHPTGARIVPGKI